MESVSQQPDSASLRPLCQEQRMDLKKKKITTATTTTKVREQEREKGRRRSQFRYIWTVYCSSLLFLKLFQISRFCVFTSRWRRKRRRRREEEIIFLQFVSVKVLFFLPPGCSTSLTENLTGCRTFYSRLQTPPSDRTTANRWRRSSTLWHHHHIVTTSLYSTAVAVLQYY